MPLASLRPDATGTSTGTGTSLSGPAPTKHQAMADELDSSIITWAANPIANPSTQRFDFDDLPTPARRVVTDSYLTRFVRVAGSFAFGHGYVNGIQSPPHDPGVAPSGFVNFVDIDLAAPISVDDVNNNTETGARIANSSGNEDYRLPRLEWQVIWAGVGGARETDMIGIVLPLLYGLGRGLNLFSENMVELEKLFRRTIGGELPGRLWYPVFTHPELGDERELLLWEMFRERRFSFLGG